MDRDEEAESIEQLLAAQSEEEVSNVPGRRSLISTRANSP
ncbi:hypothetical protein MAR_002814 [Mya arenaria]|uniref:Uncharacterized protein n=1 Tax=Mya arenaria TaxID=6604 RepID=A0ABY7GDH5_MYAAR|nr:hypothetical protein MAR_002814 [Mya arenaria]